MDKIMKKILFILILSFHFSPVFAEDISKIIAGKSFENEGKTGTFISSFDKECKNVTSYKNGVKMGTYPVTCSETATFNTESKKITFSNGWLGLSKTVEFGIKSKTFSPKEVANPK
jgi:hypothetical protein